MVGRRDENGEDEKSRIPVARSADAGSEVGQQSAETEERDMPVFEYMEEPTVRSLCGQPLERRH